MTDLEYWFDSKKGVSESQIKDKFKTMMYNGTALTAQGNDVFDAIWGNVGLRGNLFPNLDYTNKTLDELKPEAFVLFKAIVGSASNSFYNFINVK